MTKIEALSERSLLDVWDRGRSSDPAERAEIVFAAADPGDSRSEAGASPIGEVDAALLTLREATFGHAIEGVTDCPRCGESLEVSFDANDIRPGIEQKGPLELTMRDPDCRISFRLPTTADLRAASRCAAIAEGRRLLARRCVLSAAVGGRPTSGDDLPETALGEMGSRIADADPQSDIRLSTRCPACAAEWDARFDIASFLWRELDARTRDVLVDVHALALAYGWSEPEILSLPASRRRVYLELIDG